MTESFIIGPDGVAEEEAILARLKSFLVGGRVYDQIPDELLSGNGDAREIAPYIVVDFGVPYPTTGDRILGANELEQPYRMAVSVSCWGSEVKDVRRVAGAVRRLMIDWQPTDTCYPLTGGSGGGFTTTGRPTLPSRAMRQVLLVLTFNVGHTGGEVMVTGPDGTVSAMPADTVQQMIDASIEAEPVYERHDFYTAASQWTMEYALPGIPSVATYSLEGERLFTDEAVTDTQVIVTWAEPTAGFVILS